MAVERSLRTPDAAGTSARTQERADRAQPLACLLLAGRLLSATLKKAADGPTTIDHKLGRELRGWFVVDAPDPFLYPGKVSSDAKTLVLQNAAVPSLTISLWVF